MAYDRSRSTARDRALRMIRHHVRPDPARNITERQIDAREIADLFRDLRRSLYETGKPLSTRAIRYILEADRELQSVADDLRRVSNRHAAVHGWLSAAPAARTVATKMRRAFEAVERLRPSRERDIQLDRCLTVLGRCECQAEWLKMASENAQRELQDELEHRCAIQKAERKAARADHA